MKLLAQSRVESAYFVVARRGKRLCSLLLSTAVRDSRRSQLGYIE
jgi:hypothetical protein